MNELRRIFTGGSPNSEESAEAENSKDWRSWSGDPEVPWISRETGLPWIGDGCGLRIWYDTHAWDGRCQGCEIDAGNSGGHPMGVRD